MQYDLTKMSLDWLVSQHGMYAFQYRQTKDLTDKDIRDKLNKEISRRFSEEVTQ
mgnify:CR=1 FL=1